MVSIIKTNNICIVTCIVYVETAIEFTVKTSRKIGQSFRSSRFQFYMGVTKCGVKY